jgi:hypothetical protein
MNQLYIPYLLTLLAYTKNENRYNILNPMHSGTLRGRNMGYTVGYSCLSSFSQRQALSNILLDMHSGFRNFAKKICWSYSIEELVECMVT